MKRLLLFTCIITALFSTAQKAAFIHGGFIAAAYSQYDQRIKFINTYTNQVFASYECGNQEPRLWFAGIELMIVNTETVTVANFQKNEKTTYPLRGKPLYGTMAELIETADSVMVMHISLQKTYGSIIKKTGATVAAAVMSGDEKRVCIAWKKEDEIVLACYELYSSAILWETVIENSTAMELFMNNNGTLLVKWNGKSTELLDGTNGKFIQQLGNDQHCIRITQKDEIICANTTSEIVTLFSKNKNGIYKQTASIRMNRSRTNAPDGKEVVIDWDEKCVSDDLQMSISFGTRVIALNKNGPLFLFF